MHIPISHSTTSSTMSHYMLDGNNYSLLWRRLQTYFTWKLEQKETSVGQIFELHAFGVSQGQLG